MFFVAILLFVVVLVALLLLCQTFRRHRHRLPPGPWGVPIFGALPFMGRHPQLQLSKWGRKYGSVYSLYFGRKFAVILNDYDSIREAFCVDFSKNACNARPKDFVYQAMTNGDEFSEGAQWRDERRFLLKTFHELAAGSSYREGGAILEQHCQREAMCLVQQLLSSSTNKNNVVDPGPQVALSVANIIWALIFGTRLARDNALLHEFLQNQNAITQQLLQVGPIQALPVLRYLPPLRQQWRKFLQVIRLQQTLTKPFVDALHELNNSSSEKSSSKSLRHASSASSGYGASVSDCSNSDDDAGTELGDDDAFGNADADDSATVKPDHSVGGVGEAINTSTVGGVGVVGRMLAQRATLLADAEKDDDISARLANYTDKKIMVTINNLFGAGTETTVTTLKWALMYAAHFPDKQKKVYEEIKHNIGTDKPIQWSDHARLPYCQAFLQETMRRACVVPLGVVRRTERDAHIGGFFIPQDTLIFPNIWNVHMSEENFDTPLEFRPERFLRTNSDDDGDDDGGVCSINEQKSKFMAFSIGKRACVGENIARMIMFLIFANFVRKVEVREAEDAKLPSIDEYTTGITVHPMPYNVQISRR